MTGDTIGRILMEAVSISPQRQKDPALQTWTRVEYKNNANYAWQRVKSGQLPENA